MLLIRLSKKIFEKMFKTLQGTFRTTKSNWFVGDVISYWRPLNFAQRNVKSNRAKQYHSNFTIYLPYHLKPPKNHPQINGKKAMFLLPRSVLTYIIDFCTLNMKPTLQFLQHIRIFENSDLKGEKSIRV